MINDISAVIFDLDGTLVDSMWIWDKIDDAYLKERNLQIPSDLKENIEHLSFEQTAEYFKSTFNLEYSIEEIQKQWLDMAYDEYSKNVPLKPGVLKFLDTLKNAGIKIGLATSNCTSLLEVTLKSNGIYEYFDSITTTNEVSRGKNFPDVYLLSASRLGVSPESCLVFEDILPALQGAKAAGMKVVCISDEYNSYTKEELLEYADIYISSYDEMSI